MKRYIITLVVLLLLVSLVSAASELPNQETFKFTVSGSSEWFSTTKQVRPTEVITFNVFGNIKPGKSLGILGPEGGGPAESGYPCPEAKAYTVIAKLGETGKCFEIGLTKQYLPEIPGFLYLAINDDVPKDNSGKFVVEATVTRPVCGDAQCDISEEGFCKLDCQWCGDEICSLDESCSSCTSDCGICSSDLEDITNAVNTYYLSLDSKNYEAITSVTTGALNEYYELFVRFKKEVDLVVSGLSEKKKNDLPVYVPPFSTSHKNLSVFLDTFNESSASAYANYGSTQDRVALSKSNDKWMITDIFSNNVSITGSFNFEAVRDSNNNYLDTIGGSSEEDTKESSAGGSHAVLFIIIGVVIILLGVGTYMYLKKVKVRIPHLTIIPHKERSIEKKEATTKPVSTKDCSKCGTKLFPHEKFCIKCGKRVSE